MAPFFHAFLQEQPWLLQCVFEEYFLYPRTTK